VVEQPGRHVDGVAEAVAPHLDDLAARQAHLQAQRAQARRRTALVAAMNHAFEHVVHQHGGLHGGQGIIEDGHQAVAERFDQQPLVAGDGPAERGDHVRDHRGGLGIAQRLEQRRAAAQVGKQHGAVGDPGHAVSVPSRS
jgi:hypothetical protein